MYSKEIRRKIFIEEISVLESKEIISEEEKAILLNKYTAYYEDLVKEEKEIAKQRAENIEKEKQLINAKREALILQRQKELRKKVEKSPEQIRERNITAMLVLGTILLILGGLVIATNNWDKMTPLLKTLSIAFVASLFYGMNVVTGKKLKIAKTAFAFLTLGSLFIPITVLSAGYFELFGHWFSLSGSGKYLFLAIGLGSTIPVYVKHAISQKSNFYVWISYITVTLSVAFLIASFYPSKDLFYIGLLLFNLLLLYVHHKVKDKESIFTKDLPKYVQGNLALSTLLLIVLFNENETLFGMNLILTALVYLYVLFASNQKENHFVFSILFIYGFYMVVENTGLRVIDLALFSSIGFLFIAIAHKEQDGNIPKLMQYTSAIVSLISFLFVTGKSLLMFNEYSMLLLASSYLLISLNYSYLAHQLKNIALNYLTILFLVLSGTQVVWHIDSIFTYQFKPIGYFLLANLIYIILYLYNNWKYTAPFKIASLHLALVTMVFGLINLFYFELWLELIISLLIFSFVSYQVSTKFLKYKGIFTYVSALSIYGSLTAIYPYIGQGTWYKEQILFSGHLTFVALLGVVVSLVMKKLNIVDLKKAVDVAGICLYFFTVVLFTAVITDQLVPLYFAIGTFLTARMGHITKIKGFWYVSGVLFTIGFYSHLFFNLELSLDEGFIYFVLCPIILIAATHLYKKEFFVVAQVNTFFLLIITLLGTTLQSHNVAVLTAITIIFIYTFNQLKVLSLKTFYLYVTYTMLPIIGYSLNETYTLSSYYLSEPMLFFYSSVIFFILSILLKNWVAQTKHYNILFSIIGLVLFILPLMDESTIKILILFLYFGLTLYITSKSKFEMLAIIPLLLLIGFVNKISEFYSLSVANELFFYTFLFFLVTFVGRKVYKMAYTKSYVDVYSLSGIAYLLLMFNIVEGYELHMLMELIPYLLVVVFFYVQINRVEGLIIKIVKTITYVSILLPYYKLLSYLTIPNLLEMEAIVLPWLVLLIIMSKKTWIDKEKEMNYLQWIGLIITSGFIVEDALVSNTIYDALIIGVLSLAAILYGFYNRMKSYFFTGSVVLLLTILIQSKPFWGNMPWWVYLIVAGSLLIGFGSYHEWKKQNGDTALESKWKAIWETVWKTWK